MYITQGSVSGKSPEVDSIAPNLPLGNCDIDFLTFAIAAKSEISKILISLNKIKIVWSTFESTDRESESQQSTSKLNKSKVLYQEIL
jgi:hypothetical protein